MDKVDDGQVDSSRKSQKSPDATSMVFKEPQNSPFTCWAASYCLEGINHGRKHRSKESKSYARQTH